MKPYLEAWDAYHAFGEPGWSWNEAMTLHLHHGTVLSTDEVFVMARRVNAADPDAVHLTPLEWTDGGDCWNIWCAAGRIEVFLWLSERFPAEWVSFCRRDSVRVRRYKTSHILSHVTQSPETAATATAHHFHRD